MPTSTRSSKLILALALAISRVASLSISSEIRFRRGNKQDEIPIATTMAKQLMNPLGIVGTRFLVAEDVNGKRIGWAQLKPLGPAVVDPSKFNSARGSGSVDMDVDDEMWQLFEEETIEFPSGLKSLPWTPEYRAMAKAAEKRRKKRDSILARARASAGQLWELSSVFVVPDCRGRGVGSDLVRRIMRQHELVGRSASDVYALTLATTADWYRGFGFAITETPPAPLEFEIATGRVITGLIGEELVCLQGGFKNNV